LPGGTWEWHRNLINNLIPYASGGHPNPAGVRSDGKAIKLLLLHLIKGIRILDEFGLYDMLENVWEGADDVGIAPDGRVLMLPINGNCG
jgi:hypothetical protein